MRHDETDGGPAFPAPYDPYHKPGQGMTLRAYAAIHLRVPDSGMDWLDDMIRKSGKGNGDE